jgi:hypothetical protein
MSGTCANPREISFAAYLTERGIPDPGADHGGLSPSGRESKRARAARLARREPEWARYGAAQAEYRDAVDRGEIVDPTGRVRPAPPRPPEDDPRAVALERNAANLRGLAERGMRPRAYRKKAAELEAQARAIRAAGSPGRLPA